MPAAYPNGVYNPRTKENKSGVTYDPSKSTVGYAEDIIKLDDEVVAIENELGNNPSGSGANIQELLLNSQIKAPDNNGLKLNDNTGNGILIIDGGDIYTDGDINFAGILKTSGAQISSDNLSDGQIIKTKTVSLKPIAEDNALATGNNQMKWVVPANLDGMNLVNVDAHVFTASSSGNPTIQIHNATDAVDMLSTAITIDASEKDSATAATQPVIGTSSVAEGDEIRIDVDAAGTGTTGLEVRLSFR